MKSSIKSSINADSRLETIHYHLDFKRYKQHLVAVTLTFKATQDRPIVWLPSWIPGSYLMREFSRNITAVTYQLAANIDRSNGNDSNANIDPHGLEHQNLKHQVSNQQDLQHRAPKLNKSEWQLPLVTKGQRVTLHYEVYCYDLSVRTAYVDQVRLFGNFTSLALAIAGREDDDVSVTLGVPQDFFDAQVDSRGNKQDVKIACGLAHTHMHTDSHHYYQMQADSYADLIDYPFEIAVQDDFDFIIHDTHHNALAHRFYIAGKHNANLGRLQQDITHICQTYVSWLGDAPFSPDGSGNYTFMTYASGNSYGGLEHINSTSLVTPRSDLPTANEADEPSEAYQRFLGLCSHEYFHSWWVKTVRPDVMIDVDLRKEAYTPLLWVFEGFTSYIDDFMLQASKVVNTESYLKLLGTQINRYNQTHGRHLQSVAESSFDAWIKLYRADENTGNAGISYYNKGAIVALCLDLTLKQKSNGQYRIFDVVKAFYAKAKSATDNSHQRIGMTDLNLEEVVSQFMEKADWVDFKSRYVDGVEELPIQQLLEANGVSLNIEEKDNSLPWGITISESVEGLKITKVLRDSVASDAGLSAKDVLVAIDGVKATKKQLQSVAESDIDSVQCHAFRRDELMTFDIANKTVSGVNANPSLEKIELKLSESGYEQWLKPIFVK